MTENFYSAVGDYAREKEIKLRFPSSLGMRATADCIKKGIVIPKINHPFLGCVNLYPVKILEELIKGEKRK